MDGGNCFGSKPWVVGFLRYVRAVLGNGGLLRGVWARLNPTADGGAWLIQRSSNGRESPARFVEVITSSFEFGVLEGEKELCFLTRKGLVTG